MADKPYPRWMDIRERRNFLTQLERMGLSQRLVNEALQELKRREEGGWKAYGFNLDELPSHWSIAAKESYVKSWRHNIVYIRDPRHQQIYDDALFSSRPFAVTDYLELVENLGYNVDYDGIRETRQNSP